MRVALIILGVVLLLPGACGAFFTVYGLVYPQRSALLITAVPELAVGLAGLFLIYYVLRRKP